MGMEDLFVTQAVVASADGGIATSGTVIFSNSNNISFGINGQTITASAGAGGGVAISAGTQSVSTGTVVFSDSNGITFGMSGSSRITASHNGITSQTNQQMTLFATGNTTQSSTGTTNASSLIFRGEGIASVGITNGSIVLSVPLDAPSPVNFSAGTTSNDLGAVVFSNSNNVSFGLDGSTITASATVATSLTNIRVSAGTTSNLLSAITFSNSNNVSFGIDGSTITASATVATSLTNIRVSAGSTSNLLSAITFADGGGVSFGINASTITATINTSLTNIRVSAGTTSNLLSAITFSNSNNVSFGINGSTITATATVASSQGSIFLSAGTTSNSGSAFVFSNSNNVSFGINGSTITATATVATSLTNIRVSAGTTSNLLSAITFANGGGVSFGIDASTITATINTSLTNIRVSAGTTSNLLSAITFSNSNNVSFGIDGSTITATATVATSLTNIRVSAGTTSNLLSAITFSNSNNVSFGIDGSTITATATVSQSNQQMTMFATGNTTQSSTGTSNASSLIFRGAGIASVGITNGSVVLSVPAGAPSPVNFSAGTTSNDLGSVIFSNSNNVSFGLDGATITASAVIRLSAGGGNELLSAATFSNSNNVSFGINGSVVTATATVATSLTNIRVSAGAGNILLSQMTFSDSNNVSFGINASTITASASFPAQTNQTIGLYASSQTTGESSSSTYDARSITFRGAGIVSVGNSGGEFIISATGGGGGLTAINVSAGTTSNDLSNFVMSNSNNVSFGLNGSTVTASAQIGTVSMWPDVLPASTAVSTYYSGSTSQGGGGGSTRSGYTFSIYMVPIALNAPVAYSNLRMVMSNNTAGGTGSITHMLSVGFYTNNANTLSKVTQYCGGIYLSQNSSSAWTYRVWTATTASAGGVSTATYASSQGNVNSSLQINGSAKLIRVDDGVATTLTAGQYFMAFAFHSRSTGVNAYSNVGFMQSNAISSIALLDMGANTSATANSIPGWGAISTTHISDSNVNTFFGLPNAIPLANMTSNSTAVQRYHFPIMRNL